MAYQRATDSPARFQFETSSGSLYTSQVYNCGPTCVTRIAQYYRDTWYGIESNRALIRGMGPYSVNGQVVYGAPASMPTSAWQQRDMLRKRGVACDVWAIPSVTALHGVVDGGRRPVLLGLNYARVSTAVAGHSFNGWHAITVLDGTWADGQRGFLINDPNFSPPGGVRPDPDRGRRFYSDAVMGVALADTESNWAVVPVSAKVVAAPTPPPSTSLTETQEMAIMANVKIDKGRWFDCKAGVVLRKGPGTNYPVHWKTPSVTEFWLEGFYPNGWVMASRGHGKTGLFWVPPVH